jgi:hypothetical protein
MSGVDAGDAGDDEVGVPQIKKAGRDQACHTNRGIDFAFARSDLTDLSRSCPRNGHAGKASSSVAK